MRRLLLSLAFSSSLAPGCSYRRLAPVGPSLCPTGVTPEEDELLREAVDSAVAYWDALGLGLDSSCTPGAAPISVADLHDLAGVTHLSPDTAGMPLPSVTVDLAVVGWARSPRAAVRSSAVQVVAHELGHALGLGHVQDDAWSVMWPTAHQLDPARFPGGEPTDRALAAGLVEGR